MQYSSRRIVLSPIRIGKWPIRRSVRFEMEEMPDYYSAYAYVNKRPLGKIEATNRDEIFVLGDLYVADYHGARPELGNYWAPGSFRKVGIGSALLEYAIDYAARIGANKIIGGVTCDDLTASPFLLYWYEKKGFTITEGNMFREHLWAADFTIQMALEGSRPKFTLEKSAH